MTLLAVLPSAAACSMLPACCKICTAAFRRLLHTPLAQMASRGVGRPPALPVELLPSTEAARGTPLERLQGPVKHLAWSRQALPVLRVTVKNAADEAIIKWTQATPSDVRCVVRLSAATSCIVIKKEVLMVLHGANGCLIAVCTGGRHAAIVSV